MLGWLALDRAQSCQNCKDLAKHVGVSPTTAAKLLKALARDGLLNSQRGLRGGYELARDVASISVAEVVQAVEVAINRATMSSQRRYTGPKQSQRL